MKRTSVPSALIVSLFLTSSISPLDPFSVGVFLGSNWHLIAGVTAIVYIKLKDNVLFQKLQANKKAIKAVEKKVDANGKAIKANGDAIGRVSEQATTLQSTVDDFRTYSEGQFSKLLSNDVQASEERADFKTQLEQQSSDLKLIQEAIGDNGRIVLRLNDLSSQVALLMTREDLDERFNHADSVLDQLRASQATIQKYITQGDLARDIAVHLRESRNGSLAIEDSSSSGDRTHDSHFQYGFPVDSIALPDRLLKSKLNGTEITVRRIPAGLMEDVE